MALIQRLAHICCSLVLLAPLPANPQPAHDHTAPLSPERLHLSPELEGLLRQEMAAIQKGMLSLLPAIVSGNWEATADIGERIQHSYLLQQRLTAEQRNALQQALPPAFRELDHSFHQLAARLAQAARHRDTELVGFYFSRLTESCITCHTRFATHRFPGLATERSDALSSH